MPWSGRSKADREEFPLPLVVIGGWWVEIRKDAKAIKWQRFKNYFEILLCSWKTLTKILIFNLSKNKIKTKK